MHFSVVSLIIVAVKEPHYPINAVCETDGDKLSSSIRI